MSRREANGPAADLLLGVDAPVFAEPWQAEAFAMTVALHDEGQFSWGEWAQALSAQVKKPGAAVDGNDYYEHWLAALESLLVSKGLTAKADVDAMAEAWERAAHATPHGKPILLENDPRPTRQVVAAARP
ncbi:nitrile hydratase accessory protein [Mesorhizobium sp. P5_C1]